MSDGSVQLQSSCYQKNLLSAMWQLRSKGNLCDVTVQVDFQGELEEFEAHKVILAASCCYFKSVLLADDHVKKIFLSDISTNAFTKFMEYAYSGSMEVERHYVNTILQMAKLLDCQELVDVCISEVLDYNAEMLNPSFQKEGVDLNGSRTEVKTKQEPVRRAIKRKKPLKSPKTLENMEIEQDIQGRRSRRLAGRRVSVDFPLKKLKIQTENPDKSKSAGEEPASEDPQVESQAGETVAEKEACDDSGSETHHSIQEEDPQESDFLPYEEMDVADGSEKESRRGSAKYRCDLCSRSFYYEKSYLKHLKVSHGVLTDTTYRCDICQQTFANRCNLKIHQRHVHNDERLFPCDVCNKTFKRKKDVTRHKRQVHEGGTDRHFCHICGKSLSSKTALILHERTHSGHKLFKCDEIHTGEKPFACDLCEARFTQNHMLSYHKRCHTGEKPFMNCGKSFASKEYLKHHSRIHSGLRPYKCETCGRAFAQRNSLHQHTKIHTGERPYHCKDCNKLFTQLNALESHQRIHTGEKPYMYSLCERTFTDKSTIRRHTVTHDKQAPWKNFLVVLEGNVEDRVEKPKGSSQRKDKTLRSVSKLQSQNSDTGKTQEVMAVSGEPVTISGDWAGPGTIALVSHPFPGDLTVIQTEVPVGTQLQPIVTADGTSVISLDASTVGMPVTLPFSIPISVAHTFTLSPSISGPVSEAIFPPVATAATSETKTTIMASVPVPLPTSDECVTVE